MKFFFSTMNDDKIFFRIIMLIFNSKNFHLWIEELKDLALKIKIWAYINSYNQTAKSRKEILFEISHYAVKRLLLHHQQLLTILLQIKLINLRKISHNLVSQNIFMNCRLSNKKIIEQMWKSTSEKKANRQNHSENAQNKWNNSCFN
jgi:hypothetical protein